MTTTARQNKDPWDTSRLSKGTGPICGADWPALEETIGRVTSLTLVDSKLVRNESSSSSSGCSSTSQDSDLGVEELGLSDASPEPIKWPLISSKAAPVAEGLSQGPDGLPLLQQRRNSSAQSAKKSHSSGEENGGSSICSDDAVDSPTVNGNPSQKKKQTKQKWIPLILPEPAQLKYNKSRREPNREMAEKEQTPKFKGAGNGTGNESPSETSSGQNRGRENAGGIRGRGRSRGGPRHSHYHQYYKGQLMDFNSVGSMELDSYSDFSQEFTPLPYLLSPSPEYVMPYFGSSFYTPTVKPELLVELLKNQMEYYFSEENLEKDFYLRRKMDSEGYLPVHLIASFQRVQNLTQDFELVTRAILSSQKLELKEGCVRTVLDPLKWPLEDAIPISPVALPHFPNFSSVPSSPDLTSSTESPSPTQEPSATHEP